MQGIYIIRCIVNGKVYVGQTTDFKHRRNAHLCSLRHNKGLQKLQFDWNIYGETAFVFEFVEKCDDRLVRNKLEKYYIERFDAINNGYNISSGGIGQGNFNRLNGMYGKHHSERSKKLMSENRKGLTAGEKNPNYGNHDTSKYTDDVRARMSASQKERWRRKKLEDGKLVEEE